MFIHFSISVHANQGQPEAAWYPGCTAGPKFAQSRVQLFDFLARQATHLT